MLKRQKKTINESFYNRRILFIFFILFLLLISGAVFYHKIEGWNYLDAFYFSSYTLTTVGYGDFTPKTSIGKMFTIFYVFTGVSVALYGLSILGTHFVELREKSFFDNISRRNNKFLNFVRYILRNKSKPKNITIYEFDDISNKEAKEKIKSYLKDKVKKGIKTTDIFDISEKLNIPARQVYRIIQKQKV